MGTSVSPSMSRQADPVECGSLSLFLELTVKRGLGQPYPNLVRNWSRSPKEPAAGRNQRIVPRAHREAGGCESGSSGEWPCTRAYTELGGGGCHAPGEWGILWRTVTGGWIRTLIEWLQKGCGVGTSVSPSMSRQADPVECGDLVAVLGIDDEEGTWPTLPKPGRELEPFS
ncbi:hypothetical protein HAX54_031161 [Datura stramonium]|uniref:Uncharacterized protein n=1 Tax=Datura stramonium TaxID=4076 RepID=A0ABS8SBP3_DATST|nr:hypothetical protein [Datura stramonium]